MLIINPASAGSARYWERSAVYSTWLGRGAPLLGLSGPVDVADLRAVMRGLGPDRLPLTSRPGLRQRQGWDLVFAAPKSISLLAGTAPTSSAEPLRSAFRGAVADAVSVLEERAAWLRSGGEQVAARGVVAASFEHMANDAGHPHLHAHLVLANIGAKADQGWGCLVSSELWRWREALGAGFHLALRSRITEAGFGFRWELTNGGLGEIVSVPLRARAVASSRSLGLRADARSFGSASSASERAAQGKTRQAGVRGSEVGGGALAALGAAGWGPDQALEVLRHARGRPALPAPPTSREAVAGALAARGSVFGEPDVLVAVAETSPGGYDLRQAADWSRRWCEQSRGVEMAPKPARRWTTLLAEEIDRRVLDMASEARFAHLAQVSPALAEGELGDLQVPPQVAGAALALACDGAGVATLPRAPWLAQAACVDAARAAWQAAGMTVRVTCPSELSARRWRALTSLQPAGLQPAGIYGDIYGGGTELAGAPGKRVLVVDAADRLSPTTLANLLDRASSTRTKLVLVPGGTVPSPGASLARSLDQLIEDHSVAGLAQFPTGSTLTLDRPGPEVALRGILARGALSGTGAMAHLLAGWSNALRSEPAAMMVAFGPAEVEALNNAARGLLGLGAVGNAAGLGSVSGSGGAAELPLGRHTYAVGDHVLALRRIGPARSAAHGTVVALETRGLTVEWRGASGTWRSQVGPEHAGSLGYGYATTVPYLRSCDPEHQSLVVLGDPTELASRAARVKGAWVTLAGPGMPSAGLAGAAGRRRAGLVELSTCWPDEAMLERAGPRPLAAAKRRRWAEIIATCALERDLGLDPSISRSGLLPRSLTVGQSPRL
jgi:conjugative relaxase-like TrwC/TraI family protein